jgi:diguanylate cyclase (GGDEF)-like protein/PAS domain S-box-containing protein
MSLPRQISSIDPNQNHLLAALTPTERERIVPHLQLVAMPLGSVLYESGARLSHVYFPTNCIVSLLYTLKDGGSAELSLVGSEGLIGIALFMGGETTPSRAIVQSAGYAYRLSSKRIKEEFHHNGDLQLLLLRYTQALITQMAQTAVCNRHHTIDQQLCRWLLLYLDRLPSNKLTMTQELIANTLGVRREGVTEAASRLQKLGIVLYSRGHITVLDRPKLEKLCCECYAVVKQESDRLMLNGQAAARIVLKTPTYTEAAPTPSGPLLAAEANAEIAVLIDTLNKSWSRLEELTAGETDSVTQCAARLFPLRRRKHRSRRSDSDKPAAILRDPSDGQSASADLRDSDRRVSEMLNNIELVSIMLDRNGDISYCNDYLLDLTGWPRDQVLGQSFFKLFIPPDLDSEVRLVFSAMLDNVSVAWHHENDILTRSGERRLIRWNNSLLRSSDGEAIGVASIGEDLTEKKRDEIRIKRLNRVYAMLSQINALIVRVRERGELFSEACRIAVDAGAFRMAWIGVIDSNTLDGKVVAWHGGEVGYVDKIRLTARDGTPDSERPACRALRQSQPTVCNDIATDPSIAALSDELLRRGHRSLACFPLMVAGRPEAVIALFAGEPNAFDTEEMRLLSELAGNISFAVDHVEKRDRLNYLAYYDELTGLANRSLFLERVAQYMRTAVGTGCKLAVGLIDLERFKNVNHSLGRPAGDALLKQVADWLTQSLGDASQVARVDVDHFAVVFPHIRHEGELARLLDRTVDSLLRHQFHVDDTVLRVAAKIGIALFPDDGAEADTLFKNAEAALKKAKVSGDRYLFYTDKMSATVVGRLSLEYQLREALDNGEFILHYQPKINLASGKVTGAEALLRWNDPRTGLVLPSGFIPMLEETGLIYEVGRWALHTAIQDYLRWRAAYMSAVRIAVNVSPLQLGNRGFIFEVKQMIDIDTHAAAGLELEITESLIMENVEHTIASLQAIRAMRVSVAIDDFGTGFSSLSCLSKLPLDTLKIDRSFINDMTAGQAGLALVSAIINLAHSLKLNVVAEGVETKEQSRLLRFMNCDEIQGYLFSRPLPTEIFEARYLLPPCAEDVSQVP